MGGSQPAFLFRSASWEDLLEFGRGLTHLDVSRAPK